MHEQHELDAMVAVVEGTSAAGTAASFADLRTRGFSVVESIYIVARAYGLSVDASAEAITASGVWQDWAHHVERGKGIMTSSERAGAARALLRTQDQPGGGVLSAFRRRPRSRGTGRPPAAGGTAD